MYQSQTHANIVFKPQSTSHLAMNFSNGSIKPDAMSNVIKNTIFSFDQVTSFSRGNSSFVK